MNKATRTIASTMGVILGIAGLDHGLFETWQGNVPTPGLIIQAIGERQRLWTHGTEEAFSLVPNFLATGILAMLAALGVVIWSVVFLHKKHGPTVFLLLCVLLFLVGGGIAQIVFFIPAWLAATRINQPLTWSRKLLANSFGRGLAKVWPGALAAGSVLFLFGLEIAVFGYFPGVTDPERLLGICWSGLAAGWGMFLLAILSGLAADAQRGPAPHAFT